ncbi:MAG: hypothetical protein JO286_10235 [Solirubrobacterales bacterium]|nr:hypothetical protein [Solirubrobacterales bacterium]MBV9365657.1 hypothetical protein [Solirubrobacterales bacterium]MBV9681473.1 hypothetical protein [Solirubrobacterales bacterium]MBV9807550.1 hypothetical protein [Solirubrobacterales bacterium]
MLVRSKRGERSARRQVRSAHGAERPSAASRSAPAAREARHGGQSQDRALYTCECGYAFEALVTTSVGCPHCARTQAW